MDASADHIVRMGRLELHFLVEEPKPDKTIVMFEFVIPPDARVPAPHYHREVDEVLYALGGIVTSTVNGEKTRASSRRYIVYSARCHPHA